MKNTLASFGIALSSRTAVSRFSRLMRAVWPMAVFALLVAGSPSAEAQTVTNFVVFNTAGAKSWTAPNGVTNVTVLCWGSGGAGGSCSNNGAHTSIAGGGSGGGFIQKNIVPVTPGNTYNFTVPAGALGPVANGLVTGTVSNGFSTTFTGDSAVTVTAVGGNGGGSVLNGSATGSAGLHTTQTGGDVQHQGGDGAAAVSGTGSGGGGGGAGDSGDGANGIASALTGGSTAAGGIGNPYGGGTGGGGHGGSTTQSNGIAGGNPGGGGGGARYSLSTAAYFFGGAGGAGQVVIIYTNSTTTLFKSVANGNWSATSTWNVSIDGGATWSAAIAVPDSAAGAIFVTNNFTVTVDVPSTAANLMVDTGSTLVLGPAGTLNGGTYANPILLNGAINDNNVSATNQNFTGIISGTGTVTNSGASILNLNATNTFSGGLYIQNGAVRSTDPSAQGFGLGSITMGNGASATTSAISTGRTPTNAITLVTGATTAGSTIIVSNNAAASFAIYNGPITLNGNNLTIAVGGTTGTTAIRGGITGTGNLTLNADTGVNAITFSVADINNSGTITLQGASTGNTTISSTIGANVTGVTQNSASSPLILSAANVCTGNTTINAGKIVELVGGSAANSTLVIASTSVTNSLSITDNTLSWTYAGLTVSAAGDLDFNFGSVVPSVTLAPLQIIGAANFSAATPRVSVEVPRTVTTGIYPLMTWGSTAGTAPTSVTLPAGISGNLSVSNNTLNLVITYVGNILLWSGSANNEWDTTSIDWADQSNGNNLTNFQQTGGTGDTVTFDDTALSNTAIDVGITVTPSLMTFNNINTNYVFNGSGSISGAGSLIKSGTGALTLGTVNTFTGGGTVTNGTVYVGANSALGTGLIGVGNNATISPTGGSFTLSNAFSTVVAGGVTFGVTNGSLTLLSNVVSSFGNIIQVTGGSNLVIKSSLLCTAGSSSLDIFNGSRVILDGAHCTNFSDGLRLHSPGAGSAVTELDFTNNAVYLIGTTAGAPNIRLGQDANVAGTNILRISSGLLLMTNTAQAILVGDKTNTTGIVYQTGGSVNFQPAAPSASGILFGSVGGAYGEYHLDGGTLITPRVTTTSGSTGNLYLNSGTLVASANTFASAFLNGTTTYVSAGGANLDDGGFAITINQPLLDGSGGGRLTKLNTGTLTLTGTNTYTGDTLVKAGTLALSANGSISSSLNLTINPGAALDVSGTTSTYALGSQTLHSGDGAGGAGTLVGNLNLAVGSLALNYTNGTPSLNVNGGTINFSGNAVTVTVFGAPLAVGNYLLIPTNTAGTLPSTVTVNGAGTAAGTTNLLQIVNTELILTVNSAVTIPTTPTNITFSVSGGNLNLSWPSNYLGWSLQTQTNILSTNWITIPGCESITATNFPLGATNRAKFYRMHYQP